MSPSKSVKLSSRPAFARRIPDSTSPRACVSTYLLDPSTDTRSGSLCILKYDGIDGLKVENEISTSAGVFRFDFRNPSTVVAALTDGSLVIQKIEEPISSDTIPVASDMLLDLGLSDSSILITTDNKGHAYLVDLNTSLIVSSWLAHSLPYVPGEGCEVWSCSVTPNAQTVVTGGEDGSMKLWDARSKTQISQSKVFEAGVVFVDFQSEEQILTGSYDENVRIFDRRNLKDPLKVKKVSRFDLLNNFNITDMINSTWFLEIIHEWNSILRLQN
uniref:methylated diphthine methylhydrolase n=1 Tax=Caenorhabditis tropicalis TaxID=1561998 RepID=A0A1I7U3R8_9PELO